MAAPSYRLVRVMDVHVGDEVVVNPGDLPNGDKSVLPVAQKLYDPTDNTYVLVFRFYGHDHTVKYRSSGYVLRGEPEPDLTSNLSPGERTALQENLFAALSTSLARFIDVRVATARRKDET